MDSNSHKKRCFGCDRSSHTLTANCGHRTCFYCIKNNKSAKKCSKCSSSPHNRSISVSPARNKSQEKTTHLKSQETKLGFQMSPSINMVVETERHTSNFRMDQQSLLCPDHQEPLSMFCKSSKQLICSVCLCKKPKYNNEVLPIKNAEEYLRKQSKINRQEARIALSDIENAWRVVNRNRQVFQKQIQNTNYMISTFYESLIQQLKNMEANSLRLCSDFLNSKIKQYGQISDDLNYLAQTLRDYRKNSKDSNNLHELTYLHSSFKVIKTTLKSLNFDYISYEKKNIRLIQFNHELLQKVNSELIGFKFHLPIKESEKHRTRNDRSGSLKSAKSRHSPDLVLKNKHKLSQGSNSKKHKFSLCSNGSLDYGNDENNLYKKLLKSKYKF